MTATTIPAVAETEETRVSKRFLDGISEHEMTVRLDDGLYRHVMFKKPDSGMYRFDLVTWPGYLTISGDMGCYTFSRIPDMFDFFTGHGINPQYWAEKLQNAADVREFSRRVFKERVQQAYNDHVDEDPGAEYLLELWAQICDQVLYAENEHDAHDCLAEFENEHFDFVDSWEWNLTEYTYRFLWICHAIRWGVEQYKAAQ